MKMHPAHQKDLEGILRFSSFTEAEQTLTQLEILRRKYGELSDKKGVEDCRQIARLGRHRAELISKNRRVSLWKRLQKKEIATWFRIWLETPDLFHDWLVMRKNTDAFKVLVKSESAKPSKCINRQIQNKKG